MKAICLNDYLVAREFNMSDRILLFSPLVKSEDGTVSADEIYLTREEIARLAAEFPIRKEQEVIK